MKFETQSEEQRDQAERDRRQAVRNVISHIQDPVDLVGLVDELGLNAELKELLDGHESWLTAVTNARRTLQLADLDEAVADQEAQRSG